MTRHQVGDGQETAGPALSDMDVAIPGTNSGGPTASLDTRMVKTDVPPSGAVAHPATTQFPRGTQLTEVSRPPVAPAGSRPVVTSSSLPPSSITTTGAGGSPGRLPAATHHPDVAHEIDVRSGRRPSTRGTATSFHCPATGAPAAAAGAASASCTVTHPTRTRIDATARTARPCRRSASGRAPPTARSAPPSELTSASPPRPTTTPPPIPTSHISPSPTAATTHRRHYPPPPATDRHLPLTAAARRPATELTMAAAPTTSIPARAPDRTEASGLAAPWAGRSSPPQPARTRSHGGAFSSQLRIVP